MKIWHVCLKRGGFYTKIWRAGEFIKKRESPTKSGRLGIYAHPPLPILNLKSTEKHDCVLIPLLTNKRLIEPNDFHVSTSRGHYARV